MDELVHHCVRELSFDGDYGCSASRLKEFAQGFHTQRQRPQHVDESYCSFIWSLLVQKTTVIVGIVPPGTSADVAIAVQPSKNRGKKEKDEGPPGLHVIEDGKTRPLQELLEEHGDDLRIATDAETTFAAITGSHIRPSSLTAMVYTVLQLITRGREQGVSTVTIGKTTGYDQKTVFYLITKLISLDYVLKLRKPGSGLYFCIHKYFYERSDYWKDVREEESRAENKEKRKDPVVDEGNEDASAPSTTRFPDLDARHLSSLPIIRTRLLSLLERCANKMHSANNIIRVVGFRNPTKSDRRLFMTRVRALITEGLIEAVDVRHMKGQTQYWVKCLRLLGADSGESQVDEAEDVQVADIADDDLSEAEEETSVGSFLANKTLQAQIVDALEEAGAAGLTLNEIHDRLANFDRRALELQLDRIELAVLPPHLADRAVADSLETHGRERRHRYYLRTAYITAFPQIITYAKFDSTHAGEFATLDESQFYDEAAQLNTYVDSLREVAYKRAEKAEDAKEGKAKKQKKRNYTKNPVLADGSVKKGRPRKNSNELARPRKRKAEVEPGQASSEATPPTKKPRRAVNKKTAVQVAVSTQDGPTETTLGDKASASAKPARKRRQSKRAKAQEDQDVASLGQAEEPVPVEPTTAMTSPSIKDPIENLINRVELPPVDDGDLPATPSSALTSLPSSPGYAPMMLDPDPPVTQPQFAPELAPAGPVAGVEPESQHTDVVQELMPQPISQHVEYIVSNVSPELKSRDPVTNTDVQNGEPPLDDNDREETRLADTRPAKKAKVVKAPSRANMSNMLREEEFIKMLEEIGGIMSVNVKEFGEAHTALRTRMQAANEPISGPITVQADRRTVEATFARLQTKGNAKVIKTSLKTNLGTQRPLTVAYLPKVPQERVNEFMKDLSRNPWKVQVNPLRKIEDCIVYGTETRVHRYAAPLQMLQLTDPGDKDERWSRNTDRAEQLFQHGDDVIRDVLLSEFTTQAQFFGFIVPKANRARRFHCLSIQAFQTDDTPPSVVSKHHRIVKLSYFHEDLTIEEYCSVVSVLIKSDELNEMMSTEAGRRTPLRDLPRDFYDSMQINRARTRARVLDVLETLRSLNLVVPVRPSESANPWVSCAPNGDHPTAFDPAPLSGWTYSTPSEAPIFWRFTAVAPVHLWSLSDTNPPFWKDTGVKNEEECLAYWDALKEVSLSSDIARSVRCPVTGSTTGPLQMSASAVACLTRSASWKEDYILTWHQERFIKRIVMDDSWNTDSQEVRDTKLQRICNVTTAPISTILRFTNRVHDQHYRELAKLRDREWRLQFQDPDQEPGPQPHRLSRSDSKRMRAAKAVLKQRSAQAKANRLQEWDILVKKVHPDPLSPALAVRLGRLRTKFLGSLSTHLEDWEEQLSQAIKDSQLAMGAQFSGQIALPTIVRLDATGPAALTTGGRAPLYQRSVQAIIDDMGPPVPDHKKRKKKKKKRPQEEDVASDDENDDNADVVDENETAEDMQNRTRRRWHWTNELEELAQDACAVIKGRCKSLNERMIWTSLEVLFPAIPRNSVRQRIGRWQDEPPQAAYLTRLENAWLELWHQYRGSDILPDPNPYSVTDWPIIAHIEFLRKYIDKRALRAGYTQGQDEQVTELPTSVEALMEMYNVVDPPLETPAFDFMTNTLVDEGREKHFQAIAFASDFQKVPLLREPVSEIRAVAESALKMVMSTPRAVYDPEQASNLLHSIGDEHVSESRVDLLARNVFSKLIRDRNKTAPGRTLKISDANQNQLAGPMEEDVFSEAIGFMSTLTLEDNTEGESPEPRTYDWALDASDGELMAFLDLVSRDLIEVQVDNTEVATHRELIDWNSKKVDDSQIEARVTYKLSPKAVGARRAGQAVQTTWATLHYGETSSNPADPSFVSAGQGSVHDPGDDGGDDDEDAANLKHGSCADGEPACCALETNGVIDCSACVATDVQAALDSLISDEERTVMQKLIEMIEESGVAGLAEDQLVGLQPRHGMSQHTVDVVLEKVDKMVTPPFVRTGYAEIVFVSVNHTRPWTVPVTPVTPIMIEEPIEAMDASSTVDTNLTVPDAVGALPEPETFTQMDMEMASPAPGPTSASAPPPPPLTRVFPRRWLDIWGGRIQPVWNAACHAVLCTVLLHPGITQEEVLWRLCNVYDRQEIEELVRTLKASGKLLVRYAQPVHDMTGEGRAVYTEAGRHSQQTVVRRTVDIDGFLFVAG